MHRHHLAEPQGFTPLPVSPSSLPVELILTGVGVESSSGEHSCGHRQKSAEDRQKYVFSFSVKSTSGLDPDAAMPRGGNILWIRFSQAIEYDEAEKRAYQKVADFARELAAAAQQHLDMHKLLRQSETRITRALDEQI